MGRGGKMKYVSNFDAIDDDDEGDSSSSFVAECK